MATDENATADQPGVVKTGVKGFKSVLGFIDKFNYDWVLSLASGLAFNLMVATIPLIIAILALAGFIFGGLNPSIQEQLVQEIQQLFPPPLPSQEIVGLALNTLNQDAGALTLIAIVMAIIGGSGLFVAMEGQLDIIYQIRTRDIVRQYIMAFGMLLVFVVLAPFMLFANSIPSVLHTFAQKTALSQTEIVSSGLGLELLTIFTGFVATWVFIETIYLVVPNQHISFRESWFGALLAAIVTQAYLQLFPWYVTHFLSGYTGTVGFAIIFIFFFYFFAVILLGGAEINAFYAQGKRAIPENMAGLVHSATKNTQIPIEEHDKQSTSELAQIQEDTQNISQT
ncbi:MAG TPA: YhjD/YihY/BrkB family envelope integrity protein [Ktedonobacteraceae bacterium]|nr:YhjD/YihY/BrkB family envelope integrity protein [Ktedonobacteraceae bacterium]